MAESDDDQALRAKLDALKGALDKRSAEKRAEEAAGPSESERVGTSSAISMALRAASEFAAAIVVGVAIGWRFDTWFGTKPAFLIVFFLLGSTAGVWNVIRLTSPKTSLKDRNSRLSDAHAPDKDVRRSAPAAETGALSRADDDED